jgi:CheY-like chemotaxis protein
MRLPPFLSREMALTTAGSAGTLQALAQVALGGFLGLAQSRITYVGGTAEDHRVFASIVQGDGTSVVQFLVPTEAVATLMARTTDVLVIDLMQNSHDVLTLMKTAAREHGLGGRVPILVVSPPEAASLHVATVR